MKMRTRRRNRYAKELSKVNATIRELKRWLSSPTIHCPKMRTEMYSAARRLAWKNRA